MSELMTAAQKALEQYVDENASNISRKATLATRVFGDYTANLEEIKNCVAAPNQRVYSIKGTNFYLVYEDGGFYLNDNDLPEFYSKIIIKDLIDLGAAINEHSNCKKEMEEKWRTHSMRWKRRYERF